MHKFKRVLSIFIILSLLFGLTACDFLSGDSKRDNSRNHSRRDDRDDDDDNDDNDEDALEDALIEIEDIVDDFGRGVSTQNSSYIFNLDTVITSNLNIDELTDLFTFDPVSDPFRYEVTCNISFDMDADDIDVNLDNQEASVEVTFDIPDYNSMLENISSYSSMDEFVGAVCACSRVSSAVTISLEIIDDSWYVYNCSEVLTAVYGELASMDYLMVDSSDDYEYLWEGHVEEDFNEAWYVDTEYIYVELDYNTDFNVFYTVEIDGVLVYTSEENEYECYIYPYLLSQYYGEDSEIILPGDYVITYYVGNEPFDTCIAHVSVSDDYYNNNRQPGEFTDILAEFSSDMFMYFITECCWYNPDTNEFLDSFVYDSGVSYISYSIQVPAGTTDTIYYAYYYTNNPDLEVETMLTGEPVYSNTIAPTSYTNGTYYDVDCNMGLDGVYILIIAEDSSLNNIYMSTICGVGEGYF